MHFDRLTPLFLGPRAAEMFQGNESFRFALSSNATFRLLSLPSQPDQNRRPIQQEPGKTATKFRCKFHCSELTARRDGVAEFLTSCCVFIVVVVFGFFVAEERNHQPLGGEWTFAIHSRSKWLPLFALHTDWRLPLACHDDSSLANAPNRAFRSAMIIMSRDFFSPSRLL